MADRSADEPKRLMAEEPLKIPKAADVLAEHLRRRVLEGELEPGTRLPTERDLADQSGLGRSSVREALRILEIQELVRTRPGRGGGTEVARPTTDGLARSVDVFIRGNRMGIGAIVEVRELIEPECAALAAGRRSQDDLDVLEELTERMAVAAETQSQAYLQANVDWHVRVASASGNELFSGFMLAVAESVREATDVRMLDALEVRTAAVHAHRRIHDAIAAGDAAAARRRMDAHVRAYGALIDPAAERPG